MPAVDPKSPLTIMGGSGVLLLLFLFLPWYGVDLGGAFEAAARISGADTSASAWEVFSYTDLLLFVTSITAVAGFVLTSQGHAQAPTVVRAAAGLGSLMTLIVLYRIVNQPGPNDFIKVKIGAFLGLIAVAGVAYGAVRAMTNGPDARL